MGRRRRRSSPLLAALWLAGGLSLAIAVLLRLPAPAARAVLFVLAAWVIAGFLTFFAFLAVSLDDLGDVAWTAIRGSAPAMWIVPAAMLLQFPERAAAWAALALLAGAVCLLAAQRAPRRISAYAVEAAPALPMFQLPRPRRGSLFPVVLGAVALQVGLACSYADYRIAAAGSLALAAVIWTRSWVSRIAAREPLKPRPMVSSLGAIVFAILLALGSTVVAVDRQQQAGALPNPLEPQAHTSLASPIPSPRTQQSGSLGSQGASGVILKPKAKDRQPAVRLLSSLPGSPLVLAEQLSFPFTGEYHLFRTSSGRVPADAAVQEGTPFDARYVTTNGASMETQAYQSLVPPVDFARCGQIQITMRSGEVFPIGVTLQLFTDAGLEDLGLQVFGLQSGSEETLPYFVPAAAARPVVKALRLVFRHDPGRAATNTRVEVVRFTLVPRGY
jgi:hypothetical protein